MKQSLIRKILKAVALTFAGLFLFATMLTAVINHTQGEVIADLAGFEVVGVEDGGTFVDPEFTADELAEQIVLEGAVLLRNETRPGQTRPVLPLTRGAGTPQVAVLGWGATSWVPGGSGSGQVYRRVGGFHEGGPTIPGHAYRGVDGANGYYAEVGIVNVPQTNTLGALELAGIEPFQDLIDFYLGYGARPHHARTVAPGRRPNLAGANAARTLGGGFSGALRYYDFQFYRIIEPDMNHSAYGQEYTNLLREAANFSDTAIVVITRIAGESIDAPKVQYKGPVHPLIENVDLSICDPYRHYLEISTEEEELLRFAGANFTNTIVIINSTNTMELGFLETIPGLDAALFVGATGLRSASALPRLLWDFSERREILGGVPAYTDGIPAATTPTANHPVSMGERIPFNETLTEAQGRYLWPVVSPSGRTASTFAFDMRTAASWNNAGDSNQHDTAIGWLTAPARNASTHNPHAPLEFGQRYFRNITRDMNIYPAGSGTASDHGIHSFNSNFQGAGGYREDHRGVAYIDYSEGIFVGYKWYETADTMGVWDEFRYGHIPQWFSDRIGTQLDRDPITGQPIGDATRNANTITHNERLIERSIAKIPRYRTCFRTGERIEPTGFDAVVQFPFGFGLSYAEFEWEVNRIEIGGVEIDDITAGENLPISPNDEVVIYVRVTNVGTVPGMEVVQLYSNPPWTAELGLEMSSANLLAFGKTYQVLHPRGTPNLPYWEVVRLPFLVYDLASFDTYNVTGLAPGQTIAGEYLNFGGFVLVPGIFEVTVRHNSHQVSEDPTGDIMHSSTINLQVATGHRFTYDPLNFRECPSERTSVVTRFSGNAARSRTTGGDGVPIADTVLESGEEVQRMAQMTRTNFTETFPVLAPSRDITPAMIDINLFRQSHAILWRENFHNLHPYVNLQEQSPHVATGTGFTVNGVNFDPNLHAPFISAVGVTAPNAQQEQIWRNTFTPITPPDGLEGDALRNWYIEHSRQNETDRTMGRDRTRLGELSFALVHNNGNWNAPWHPRWDDLTRLMAIGTPSTVGAGQTTNNPQHLIGDGWLRSASPWALGEKGFALIGRPRTFVPDATNQMNSFRDNGHSGGSKGIGWPNATTVAQTFSYRLARRQGWEKGRESRVRGVSGMLSPGIHIHRSPLNGRNFEYYSESGFLTGVIASNYIRGMMDMGIYTYIKHLAVYVQESNRNGLYIFLTEQALREVYLVPFRMGMNRYAATGHGSLGIMSGYSRLGAMWEGGSFHLLTTVTRREWGFRGAIMTDWADNGSYMSMDQKIRAGGDKGMGHSNIGRGVAGQTFTNAELIESNEIRWRIREAARNLNYTWFFAEYMHANFNAYDAGVTLPPVTNRIPNFNVIGLSFQLIWFLGLPLSIIAVLLAYFSDIKALFKKQ
ncbi:MAG: glycoside hydrolase family 3 C-terminal domain-containing protein [Firmicutes bacterium]|nr:glycoside hydrolase family 3 C-terminal domain-containing protein [Bacillota bacterium]